MIRLKYEIAYACEGWIDLDHQIGGEAESVPRIVVTRDLALVLYLSNAGN